MTTDSLIADKIKKWEKELFDLELYESSSQFPTGGFSTTIQSFIEDLAINPLCLSWIFVSSCFNSNFIYKKYFP